MELIDAINFIDCCLCKEDTEAEDAQNQLEEAELDKVPDLLRRLGAQFPHDQEAAWLHAGKSEDYARYRSVAARHADLWSKEPVRTINTQVAVRLLTSIADLCGAVLAPKDGLKHFAETGGIPCGS
jgi:hypothetical protein